MPKDSQSTSTQEAKPIIRVKNLYKIYSIGTNKVRALNGVDFTINEGEFCAIVGTSGSGKSTLLNMLAGLEKPSKGEISINGTHIEKMNENQLVRFRREHVGFIFQSYNLMGTMTALENVALPLNFRGIPKKIRNRKADKMLNLVGLQKYKKHKPNQMSGGQQQRVGMARALVLDPDIVFADEPTGNLDSATSEEMMNLMRQVVNEQKKTLVMVTHDDHLASYADRIIRIVDGKIVALEENRNRKKKVEMEDQEIIESQVEETNADVGKE
ncbi:MAG: ABC transporter ATP-binding protein [Lachnospiraceae bacterium]|nr:ABC transporter ATP-binding protein [Lachnospiraceae bacterium]